MLFFLLCPLFIFVLIVIFCLIKKAIKEDAAKAISNRVSSESKPKTKKSTAYLDLDNLDNVDDFSILVYKYTKELVDTYGRTISTRQVINQLHVTLEEVVRHLNQNSNFSFIKYYHSRSYSHQRKPTDVFFKNDNENVSTYRYHILDELIPYIFLKENSLKIDGVKTYFINKDSDTCYLWDKLAIACESDNGFNDRYSSASIYCALAIVLAIHHVIQNRLKVTEHKPLDDYLVALEVELDIAHPPKACDNTVYCPKDGIRINSQNISKILNIFKRD